MVRDRSELRAKSAQSMTVIRKQSITGRSPGHKMYNTRLRVDDTYTGVKQWRSHLVEVSSSPRVCISMSPSLSSTVDLRVKRRISKFSNHCLWIFWSFFYPCIFKLWCSNAPAVNLLTGVVFALQRGACLGTSRITVWTRWLEALVQQVSSNTQSW